LAGVFHAAGGRLSSPAGLAMSLAYMVLPMTMALVVQKLIHHQPVLEPLRINLHFNRWFLVAWLLPPLLAFAALGAALFMPGVTFDPQMHDMFSRFATQLSPDKVAKLRAQVASMPVHPIWLALAQGLAAGATVNALAGFGEELGWRGLLLKELSFLGFWRASFIIGLVWGIWHAPIILMGHNYPQHPVPGVYLMTDFTLLFSPLIAYVTLKSRSVLAAAIMHGTLNGTYGLGIMTLRGGNDLTVGLMGLAGLGVLLAANVLLFLYDRFLAKEPITRCLAWE